MATDRKQPPLAKFGPYIFLGGGALLAAVIVFLGMNGEFKDLVLSASDTARDVKSRIEETKSNVEKTGNANLAKVAKHMPDAAKGQYAAMKNNGFGLEIKVAFDLPKPKPKDPIDVNGGGNNGGDNNGGGTNGGTTQPPPPTETVTLISAHSIDAQADDARRAIFVRWNVRDRKKEEKNPADIGWFVYRTTADAEGKPDASDYTLLTPEPITGTEFIDLFAPPDKAWFYAVVQASKDPNIAAGAEAKKEGEYFVTAKLVTQTSVGFETQKEPEWFFEKVLPGGGTSRPMAGYIRRWDYVQDPERNTKAWVRLTLWVNGVAANGDFGGRYTIEELMPPKDSKELAKTPVDNVPCRLTVEHFDGTAIKEFERKELEKTKETIEDAIRRHIASGDRSAGRNFNTGLKWVSESSGTLTFKKAAGGVEQVDAKDKKWDPKKPLPPIPAAKLEALPVVEQPADPNGGTDPNGGNTDPNSGNTDPNGGTDPSGSNDPASGGGTDPASGGASDPAGGTTDPAQPK
ncbi:MAG: hypothetical protein L6Q71_02695 [Planctomycetes bacterium]|nr:hypothetical protein [Planctomycetota bacterium]NUQ35101.1 hypothetical protein [Planctomycetaceae bacterium]